MKRWGMPVMRFSVHPMVVLCVAVAIVGGVLVEYSTIFFWIIVHECGHLWAARMCRWNVRLLSLTPLGAVLDCDDAVSMRSELCVVCGGLGVSLLVVCVLWGLVMSGVIRAEYIDSSLDANIRILLFNMLPIWPLDGGRLLRLGCAVWLPYVVAVRVSAVCGMMGACALCVWAFLALAQGVFPVHIWVLAGYVFFVNFGEWKHALMRVWRTVIDETKHPRVHTIALKHSESLIDVLRYVRRGRQFVVIVHQEGKETMLTQAQWWKHFLENKT